MSDVQNRTSVKSCFKRISSDPEKRTNRVPAIHGTDFALRASAVQVVPAGGSSCGWDRGVSGALVCGVGATAESANDDGAWGL